MKALRFFKEWKPWFIYSTVAVVGLAVLWVGADLISHYGSKLLVDEVGRRPEVARLVELKGRAKKISEGAEQALVAPLKQPVPFRDGDRVEFSDQSTGTLILGSQDELKADVSTNLMFQLWNKKDPQSPLYLHLLAGRLSSIRQGVSGRAYVIYQGKLFLLGQSPKETRTPLILNKMDLEVSLSENQLADAEESDADAADEEALESVALQGEPQTLSNEYIDETISRRQFQLQKCWLSRVRTSVAQKGRVVVQIEISARGKVKNAQITDSDLKDEVLHKCVLDVMNRISFRPFKGPEISLSYPLQFE